MLNKEEFLRLQKLAAISLNDEETEKLANQLGGIVNFLGKLRDIQIQESIDKKEYKSLIPISGVENYDSADSLFINANHEKIDNSIVVNYVVDN